MMRGVTGVTGVLASGSGARARPSSWNTSRSSSLVVPFVSRRHVTNGTQVQSSHTSLINQLTPEEWNKRQSKAMFEAALSMQKAGRVGVSKQLFEQAYKLQKTLHEQNHLDSLSPLTTLTWLGLNTANQGKLSDAEQALSMVQSYLDMPSSTPTKWDTFARLAVINVRLDRPVVALNYIRTSIAQAKQELGENDSRVADLLYVQAKIEQQESATKALKTAELAFAFPELKPTTKERLRMLVFKLNLQLKQYARTLTMFEEIKKVKSPDATQVQASALEMEGLLAYIRKDFTLAADRFSESLDMHITLNGSGSFEEAIASYELACALEEKEAADKVTEDSNSDVRFVPLTKQDTLLSLSQISPYMEHYSRAIEIYRQHLGEGHPDTKALLTKVSPTTTSVPLEGFVYDA